MRFRDCAWQAEISQALSAGHWPDASGPELRSHVDSCSSCNDLVLVTESIRDARRASVLTERPISPSLLWWRAQLRKRYYAAEQMSKPISFAQIFAGLTSSVLTIIFVVSQYRYGLRWGDWWSEINAPSHVLHLWSLAARDLQWNLFLVMPIVGVFLLLCGIVLYVVRE